MHEAETNALLKQGENCYISGNLEGAKRYFVEASKVDPEHVDAFNNLGVVSFQEKKYDAAVSYFEKAAALDPKNFEILENIGKCWQTKGKPEKAVEWYQKALQINGKHYETLNFLGDCFVRVEAFDKAAKQYRRSLDINPHQANVKTVLQRLEARLLAPELPNPRVDQADGVDKIKVLYVDTISTPTAACNINGTVRAFMKVSHLKIFDYRLMAEKFGVEQMNNMLVHTALEFKPDLIHLGKSESISGLAVKAIKDRIDTCVIHFYGDFRWDPQPWVVDIGKYADCTLFNYTDERILDRYRAAGVKNIGGFWDSGADPGIFYPREVAKSMDVVFMGSNLNIPHDGYEKRRQLVEAILQRGFDLHIFGEGWQYLQNTGFPNPHLHPFVTENAFAEVCSKAKITLGINGVNDIKMYASWRRAMNTMASGAFHLTHYVPGMETFFDNKKHLAWFNSVPEALDLIAYYLEHEKDRETIAEAGRDEILKRHTWDARIEDQLAIYRTHRAKEDARKTSAYEDLRNYKGVTNEEIERRSRTDLFDEEWERVWDSKERTSPEQIKSAYNETDCYLFRNVWHNYHTQKPRFEFTSNHIRQYCRQFPQRTIRLLDYGSGSGCLEQHLLDIENLHIDLADIPSETFSFVKWRYRKRPQVSYVEIADQRCLKEMYDIIICYDVLEHVPEPLPVLTHLDDHLATGGIMFFFFCTAIPEGEETGPSGHLKTSIDQNPMVQEYLGKYFQHLGNNLYIKTGNVRKVEEPAAFEFRTICEVHRELADKVHESAMGDEKEAFLDLIAEAFDMAKRMNRKLRQYKSNYDEGMWEPNDDYEADLQKRLIRLGKRKTTEPSP